MNDYEKRKQDRIDRYRERAEKARQESSDLSQQAHKMASAIPFGQPLMPDHSFYKRDVRYREKISNKQRQSIAASEKADYYEEKARAAENNHAISSDDPDAIAKLTERLEKLQKAQTRMKQLNAYYRKHGTCKGFHGINDKEAAEMDAGIESDYPGARCPYPSFELSLNNKEIHRLQDRIKQLTTAQELGYVGWEFDGGRVEANSEKNRLQIFFDEKPDEDVRRDLKGWGFKWARSEGAWQRQLTDNAIYAASRVKAIAPIDGTDPCKIQPKRKARNQPER